MRTCLFVAAAFLSTVLLFTLSFAAFADENKNPIVEEMRQLDGVFREIVSAVAVGDGKRVYDAVMSMEGAMEEAHEGLRLGRVKIPKNADLKDEFIKTDLWFHEGLDAIAEAGIDNDHKAMVNLAKKLLDACVDCHRRFK